MKTALGVLVLTAMIQAQSALFLLISPGARAGGMGEAQVALANDSYASYWNPAGLGFQEGYEISGMHVNWLPGLADDMYYDFLAGRVPVKNLGVFGAHIIYLNAGQQIWTDSQGNVLGEFTTYFMAGALSYSTLLRENSSVGFNFKILHQHLADKGIVVEGEETNPIATNFGFDFGYLRRALIGGRMDIGLMVSNLGPKVVFNDEDQADPMPTNLKAGFNLRVFDSKFNKINLVYDMNKLLVGSYPAMDWDGDGFVGGYDQVGTSYIIQGQVVEGEYNGDGQLEIAHTDPWYKGLFTSWLDDWYLGGDRDLDGDRKIGGYAADTTATEGGLYNSVGDLEVGNADERKFSAELETLVHNVGVEYWYNDLFAIRAGFYYDRQGKIAAPTVGAGIRYGNYGFDFGYTSEKENHPLANTMRFSLLLKF